MNDAIDIQKQINKIYKDAILEFLAQHPEGADRKDLTMAIAGGFTPMFFTSLGIEAHSPAINLLLLEGKIVEYYEYGNEGDRVLFRLYEHADQRMRDECAADLDARAKPTNWTDPSNWLYPSPERAQTEAACFSRMAALQVVMGNAEFFNMVSAEDEPDRERLVKLIEVVEETYPCQMELDDIVSVPEVH